MYLGKEASIAQWIHLRLSALKSEQVHKQTFIGVTGLDPQKQISLNVAGCTRGKVGRAIKRSQKIASCQ